MWPSQMLSLKCRRARFRRVWSLAAGLSRFPGAAVVATCCLGLVSAPAQATTGYELRGQFSTTTGIDPKSVAVDSSTNNVYVVTPFTSAFTAGIVEQFSATGNFLGRFEGAQSSEFSGVAVDPANDDVYAYDYSNQSIDAFDSSGTPLNAFAGGTTSSLPVSGRAEVQIASDLAGNIYYPNQALEEVQEFRPDGTPLPVTITGLMRPTDVAVSSTTIYVIDISPSTGLRQVQQFNSSGTPVGTGVLGSSVLSSPKAVSVDSSGDAFVIDESPSGIVVDEFDPMGILTHTLGAGIISGASTIAVDSSSGELYVLENTGFSSPHGPVLIFASSSVTVPSATTGSPVGVAPSVETVAGTVDPEGTDTNYYFQYGVTSSYGQSTSATDAGPGTTSSAAQATLSALEPTRTYHYRLVATDVEGDQVYGADQTFTTEAAPPVVNGERASSVTSTDAALEAQINPNNQAAVYYFRYGTSPTLTGATAVPSQPGLEVSPGFGEFPVRQDVGGGLSPNTTYYFQVVATNATDSAEGPIESFTTLPPAPLAVAEAPSFVTETTATLNGTVTTQDIQTTYSFQYVNDADFKNSGYQHATSVPQPELDAEASLQPVPVTAFVGGLTPDTTYHVRFLADNAGGFTEDSEQTFTTVVLPPSVASGLAVSITPTTVTVNGGVDPEGGRTTYRFQYVDEADFLSSGYQKAASVPQPGGNAGSSGEPQIVTGTFSNLAPSSAYHYRLTATNAGGTTEGADETLSTPAEGGPPAASGSPFGIGTSSPLPGSTYPDLSSLTPTPEVKSPPATGKSKRSPTRAQKLQKALEACTRDRRQTKRAGCEKAARHKYEAKPKPKK
jgi:hypothetical protein